MMGIYNCWWYQDIDDDGGGMIILFVYLCIVERMSEYTFFVFNIIV